MDILFQLTHFYNASTLLPFCELLIRVMHVVLKTNHDFLPFSYLVEMLDYAIG